jgi:hypothetical protein
MQHLQWTHIKPASFVFMNFFLLRIDLSIWPIFCHPTQIIAAGCIKGRFHLCSHRVQQMDVNSFMSLEDTLALFIAQRSAMENILKKC